MVKRNAVAPGEAPPDSGHEREARQPSGNAQLGWYRRPSSWIAVGTAALVLAVAVAFAVTRSSQPQTNLASIRVSGIPSNVPTALAGLMSLSPEQHGNVTAPDFTLTDQHGSQVSLSSFRGHPVVLTFFDPRCVTMCPIMSQEFVEAERHLVRVQPRVVFVAVNVNRHALGVATVAAFTNEHKLNAIPTWHFLTGTLPTLKSIWHAYGIEVATRIVHGKWTVLHTTVDYFIGPQGKERFVAAPNADFKKTPTHLAYLPSGTSVKWGRGIALVARDT